MCLCQFSSLLISNRIAHLEAGNPTTNTYTILYSMGSCQCGILYNALASKKEREFNLCIEAEKETSPPPKVSCFDACYVTLRLSAKV